MEFGRKTYRVGEQSMRASATQKVPADLFVRPNQVRVGNPHCLWTHHLLQDSQEGYLLAIQKNKPPEASFAFRLVGPFS